MSKPIESMSSEEKILEMLDRSKKYFDPGLAQQIDAFLSPQNVVIMSATFLLWIGSHAFGVGEIVDVGLLIFGAVMLGPQVVTAFEKLIAAAQCVKATTEAQMEECGKAFADAVIIGGIATVQAILLKKAATNVTAARAGTGTSWVKVAKPKGKPGLSRSIDPEPRALWSKAPVAGQGGRAPGAGGTSAFGKAWYSLEGTWQEINLGMEHELVHRFFSPRFFLLRSFRANLSMSAYKRIALLRYLQEALAESYAQARVNGFGSIIKGVRFPIAEKYVTVTELLAEGEVIGSIVVGSQRLTVALVFGPPSDWDPILEAGDLPTDSESVVGWWWVWAGAHFWTYVFEQNGNVRWTDPYNHQFGSGKWMATGTSIVIKWAPPSTTLDYWDLPVSAGQQTGLQRTKAGDNTLKAVRIPNTSVIHNIAGRWKMTAGKWTWIYEFDAGGRVKWTDPFNGQTGRGQWTFTKDTLYIWWSPASRTTEDWKGPFDRRSLEGTVRMSNGTFTGRAEKVS